jgi:hypothetical protein
VLPGPPPMSACEREANIVRRCDRLGGLLHESLLGGAVQRTSMSAAMLFAQPLRVPTEFFTEQHVLGQRPGQLEASTAMARALIDATGQREVLLDQLHTPDDAHPGHLGRMRLRLSVALSSGA